MPDEDKARAAVVLMVVPVNQSWTIPVAYFLIKHLARHSKYNQQVPSQVSKIEISVTALSCSWLYDVKMLNVLGASLDLSNTQPILSNQYMLFWMFPSC